MLVYTHDNEVNWHSKRCVTKTQDLILRRNDFSPHRYPILFLPPFLAESLWKDFVGPVTCEGLYPRHNTIQYCRKTLTFFKTRKPCSEMFSATADRFGDTLLKIILNRKNSFRFLGLKTSKYWSKDQENELFVIQKTKITLIM